MGRATLSDSEGKTSLWIVVCEKGNKIFRSRNERSMGKVIVYNKDKDVVPIVVGGFNGHSSSHSLRYL